jgi:TetR/AcrR family transcriptional regulator, transcriptional repressor for nem operon
MQAVNTGPNAGTIKAWRAAFRRALEQDGRMCLCGMLGAEIGGLPPEIVSEVQHFFDQSVNGLMSALGKPSSGNRAIALRIMASLEGAMLLARVFEDPTAFDQATQALDALKNSSTRR